MSFMFNPSPYDEKSAVNHPKLSKECIDSLKIGANDIAADMLNVFTGKTVLIMEGYASVDFAPVVNLIKGKSEEKGIDIEVLSMEDVYRDADELAKEFEQYLPCDKEKDPVLLFGRRIEGGYSNIVNGNDLNAYYYQAGALGVYKNVNTSGEYVTRRDAYVMIHNSLNVDVMTENFGMFGTGSYEVVDGNTLKSYLQTAQHYNLTKKTGVVTADRFTYLHDTEIGKDKTNIIQIDGEVLKCNFDVPNGLVGMAVDYYMEYNDGNVGVVTSIQPTSKNTVVEFNLEDFISASSNVLKYNDNDNTLKIKYDETTKVVYNNRRERNWSVESIANYNNGILKAIDNNEDEVYDIMYIYDYKDAIVERIYAESNQLYFANSQVVDGKRYLSLDDEKILVNIIDAEGKKLSVDQIPVDSVVSIAKSNDKKLITVIVSDKKVTGVVKLIEDEFVTIGSDVYECASNIIP